MNTSRMPRSYSAARDKGAAYYFTGSPCNHGHVAPRRVISRQCYECHKLGMRKRYGDGTLQCDAVQPESVLLGATRRARGQTTYPVRPCPERCEVCDGRPNKRGLVEDHCHDTGHFRAWLCHRCNVLEGWLRAGYLLPDGGDEFWRLLWLRAEQSRVEWALWHPPEV
jgi:hypothetical protein